MPLLRRLNRGYGFLVSEFGWEIVLMPASDHRIARLILDEYALKRTAASVRFKCFAIALGVLRPASDFSIFNCTGVHAIRLVVLAIGSDPHFERVSRTFMVAGSAHRVGLSTRSYSA